MWRGGLDGLRRILRDLSATASVSWVLSRTLHRADKLVFRLTEGKHTLSSLMTGLPVVMLSTTGARSGKVRAVPVLGLRDGDRIVVFASGYGQRVRFPAWYHNLRSEPEARVAVEGLDRRVRAYEAEGEERDLLWHKGLEIYPGFADYEQRVAGCHIPVMVLSPLR